MQCQASHLGVEGTHMDGLLQGKNSQAEYPLEQFQNHLRLLVEQEAHSCCYEGFAKGFLQAYKAICGQGWKEKMAGN